MVKRCDPLSPQERSERMSRIRASDTKPEKLVRKLVFGMGFRYRLHQKSLPGSPDLVFTKRKKVIFVHGCFWHQHYPCRQYVQPKTKQAFWLGKLAKNVARDKTNQADLKRLGWRFLVIWECQLKREVAVKNRIRRFLEKA